MVFYGAGLYSTVCKHLLAYNNVYELASLTSKKSMHKSLFVLQVKEIEKRDSVLTPKQQLDRLLRPGSTYFNLNPYEVLQVDHDATLDEIKKKYRRLSILVHPDKNMVSL